MITDKLLNNSPNDRLSDKKITILSNNQINRLEKDRNASTHGHWQNHV